ncbi:MULTISPECIES: hydroxyectoine utilization dehydratase EutB [unclassified Mesorhizobium]|uniref:hydroxyectoine utilization dehydratase EutB n=1 Tax=unclassified Mesorhizobium TaxID=325217 RepID=UPI0004CE7AD0|nr:MULTISPECIES: hydroxyectoine utilization dehydratase EutB [unclassified Mesorhizobium]WJI74760.1 hydroxyectoine utilization dehydratase EutB [Mesorhizobium sp. C395A]
MIELKHIEGARNRIGDRILRTPIVLSSPLSAICDVPVYLKLEHQQTTGSFKLRGAFNAVLQLSRDERSRGVVAVSTGNHGRALSFAANTCGVKATICMSALVPENKVSEIRRLGAEVRIIGRSQDEAQEEAERLASNEGLCLLPPFDHPAIIAGQGTLGLEIAEALPDVATVLIGLSGGGLASGVALAIKGWRPKARVIGLTMDRGAAMKASLDARRPVQVAEFESLADSLGGGIGLANKWTFAMCRDLLDDVVLLSETEIAAGMQHAYMEEREVVEGAGAVGIAALLANKVANLRGPVVTVLSGRNVDMHLHRRVVSGATVNFRG